MGGALRRGHLEGRGRLEGRGHLELLCPEPVEMRWLGVRALALRGDP